jgi:hypothetical protein
MLEGRRVVYGGDDAVEERGGVEGGGRVCRVVDGSVIVCEQSVVIHCGYEGVAVRIWGRGDKHGMLLRRLVSPGDLLSRHSVGWNERNPFQLWKFRSQPEDGSRVRNGTSAMY